MIHNDGKRLYTALLVGAALAVTLVAALTAWAAHLGGAAWLPVLVPFAVVLAVPMTALARLRRAGGTDVAEASAGGDSQPASRSTPRHSSSTTGRAA